MNQKYKISVVSGNSIPSQIKETPQSPKRTAKTQYSPYNDSEEDEDDYQHRDRQYSEEEESKVSRDYKSLVNRESLMVLGRLRL
jgi:hypothetical protein